MGDIVGTHRTNTIASQDAIAAEKRPIREAGAQLNVRVSASLRSQVNRAAHDIEGFLLESGVEGRVLPKHVVEEALRPALAELAERGPDSAIAQVILRRLSELERQ